MCGGGGVVLVGSMVVAKHGSECKGYMNASPMHEGSIGVRHRLTKGHRLAPTCAFGGAFGRGLTCTARAMCSSDSFVAAILSASFMFSACMNTVATQSCNILLLAMLESVSHSAPCLAAASAVVGSDSKVLRSLMPWRPAEDEADTALFTVW